MINFCPYCMEYMCCVMYIILTRTPTLCFTLDFLLYSVLLRCIVYPIHWFIFLQEIIIMPRSYLLKDYSP